MKVFKCNRWGLTLPPTNLYTSYTSMIRIGYAFFFFFFCFFFVCLLLFCVCVCVCVFFSVFESLVVKVYRWVLLQLVTGTVTHVYQIVITLGHVAISYFFFCDFYSWKKVSKWEWLNEYTAWHHTTPSMIELHNVNVTDRFVAIPYAVVRCQKRDSQRFVTVLRAD